MLVAKGSTCISIVSSVVTRISQCAALTDTYDDAFTMFLVMEVFYDIVGLIIRVTLHHRQLLTDTIFSGNFWKSGTFKLNPQNPRNRLTVAHSIIVDYTCFIALYATRVSLLKNVDGTWWAIFVGVFVGCSILQMLCAYVTHVLVRKVEAVPLEELDVSILPCARFWTSQVFYVSLVLCYIMGSTTFMYEAWYSMELNMA
eukprot:PhF_6_TR20801/c0_g1_i2/m.29880